MKELDRDVVGVHCDRLWDCLMGVWIVGGYVYVGVNGVVGGQMPWHRGDGDGLEWYGNAMKLGKGENGSLGIKMGLRRAMGAYHDGSGMSFGYCSSSTGWMTMR